MVEPIVVPRSEHSLSRRDIDPDALKVLYRLRDANYIAYLVGGSVRDLLLGRAPKDFDIGTSAHPYQVKRLFRNCWIIGRRFRLAHVKFGQKVIEVATFRRQVPPIGDESGEAPRDVPVDLLIHHDNTFGTPEEDAFRRDFTINALFYDIATFSIIDYVGGLRDLKERVVRAIGVPEERFREDPVRMLRAIALAARLDFALDPPVVEAIRTCRAEISRSAPARLLEEYYKVLRLGSGERTFRLLTECGLLEAITPELHEAALTPALWRSLAALDAYRRNGATGDNTTPGVISEVTTGNHSPSLQAPAERLTNPILLGTLLVPLGFSGRMFQAREPIRMTLGMLPLPRRELERLRHILALQSRLADGPTSPRSVSNLMSRGAFPEAVTWLEIHGKAPDAAARWRELENDRTVTAHERDRLAFRPRRRRRRYRRPVQPQ